MTVTADGPAIDLERFVAAVPLLIERARGVAFDPDGTAVIDGEPAPRLRLVDGVAGQEGAAYFVAEVAEDDAPVIGVVMRDRADELVVRSEAAHNGETLAGTVRLERPADPAVVHVDGVITVTGDVPAFVGREFRTECRVRLVDFHHGAEPQVALQFDAKPGTLRTAARIDRLDGNPGSWRVTVNLDLRPRGLARLLVVAWPVVKRRVAQQLTEQIRVALVETAQQIDEDFSPTAGPQEIADRAWAMLVAELTSPAGQR